RYRRRHGSTARRSGAARLPVPGRGHHQRRRRAALFLLAGRHGHDGQRLSAESRRQPLRGARARRHRTGAGRTLRHRARRVGGGVLMIVERRTAARRTPAPDETLARLRLRTGRELSVVDIGDTGALVEGTARLLPGTHVEVHVVTREGRTLVRSRVTRAWVFAVAADILQFRAALAF